MEGIYFTVNFYLLNQTIKKNQGCVFLRWHFAIFTHSELHASILFSTSKPSQLPKIIMENISF